MDSLLQLHVRGDRRPRDYSLGHTMRNGESCDRFAVRGQDVDENEHGYTIVTCFCADDGQEVAYTVFWPRGGAYAIVQPTYINGSSSNKTLEYFTSFSLGIVPQETENLTFYRLRSQWSAEGRLCGEPLTRLQMEPSWLDYGARSERYGQVGSMPVRRFYPFAGLTDHTAGISWGAVLCCPASWQMELYRKNRTLSLSGGQADYEFGHWCKTLRPGERFGAPSAVLTVVEGDIEEVFRRLVTYQRPFLDNAPAGEADLPLLFNEFCTTWGEPSEQNLLKALDVVKDKGIRYFVIDAGWYRPRQGDWGNSIGDWNPNPDLFPRGIDAVTQAIREADMVPGIWFEFESVADQAEIYRRDEWLLHRDGETLRLRERAFLDIRRPDVNTYLEDKVIAFMKQHGFKYLKIDYNDTIGPGCDGAESLGEGLRQVVESSQEFIRKIRQEIPDAVIEICSSGGHRLEPSMLSLASMGSFSDAHKCVEGPIIAANQHRVMQPAMSQIWAVVHAADDRRRLEYVLAGAFLGRFCLSGEVCGLADWQWRLVREAIAFYRQAVPILRDGVSYRYGPDICSYREPEGWQALLRVHTDGRSALLVVHNFGGEERRHIILDDARFNGWTPVAAFGETLCAGTGYKILELPPFSACAVLLIGQGDAQT